MSRNISPSTNSQGTRVSDRNRKLSAKAQEANATAYEWKSQIPINKDKGKKHSSPVEKEELFPVPAPVDKKAFAKLTPDQKMGNLVSVINMLSRKLEEQDAILNHNTDGLETRVSIMKAQVDNNTSEISQRDENIKELKIALEEQQVTLTDMKQVLLR